MHPKAIPIETISFEDFKHRSSMERKKVTLPGLDFLFAILYVASVGFLVRNHEGAFKKPRWYALYSAFSIVHTMFAFYGIYRFAMYTTHFKENTPNLNADNTFDNDTVTLRLVFICIFTLFVNAVLSKLCTCIKNESRRKYYTEMESAYIDICGDCPRANFRIWLHLAISLVLHMAVFAVTLSFTTMEEFQRLSAPYREWFPAASEVVFVLILYSAFSMSTVANATCLIVVHSACTLTEMNRSLNERLRLVTSARHTRWWYTRDATLLLDRYRTLFRLYGEFKDLLGFRVFSQFTVITLNLIITTYLQYMDAENISDPKIRTISGNVLFFVLLAWSAYEVQRMKTEAEIPVQLLSSSRYLPPDPKHNDELRMFIVMWQSQDVRISGWGFFTVDLSLVVSIISTVVTYTVILVQVKSYRPCYSDMAGKNVTV